MQVTKDTQKEAGGKRGSGDGGAPIVELTATGSVASGDAEEACAADALPLPAVTTLLDFVAWVVLSGLPPYASRLGGWVKGRGGFLADELNQVHKAAVCVQARLLFGFALHKKTGLQTTFHTRFCSIPGKQLSGCLLHACLNLLTCLHLSPYTTHAAPLHSFDWEQTER